MATTQNPNFAVALINDAGEVVELEGHEDLRAAMNDYDSKGSQMCLPGDWLAVLLTQTAEGPVRAQRDLTDSLGVVLLDSRDDS